ncbi:MAG: helix-turn-helix transcriptional regulator [Actinomycetes bacterium]
MPLTTKQRAQRILQVLAYVLDEQAQGNTALVDDISARFGIDERELTEDMNFVFYNVGVYPFSPDSMVEVTAEDGIVSVRMGDYFYKPLHLTADEGVRLLTAGEALLHSGTTAAGDSLRSAIGKLRAALGADGQLDVRAATVDPAVLAQLEQAVADHETVEMEYLSYARDESATRQVDPYWLQMSAGYWYLQAWCHEAADFRMFRVDRVLSSRGTGTAFEPTDDELRPVPGPGTGSGTQTVVLEVPSSGRWIADMYPVESVAEVAGDRLRIEIRCGTTAFLERLLLRLPPASTAFDAERGESVLPVRAAAARRILSRYGG